MNVFFIVSLIDHLLRPKYRLLSFFLVSELLNMCENSLSRSFSLLSLFICSLFPIAHSFSSSGWWHFGYYLWLALRDVCAIRFQIRDTFNRKYSHQNQEFPTLDTSPINDQSYFYNWSNFSRIKFVASGWLCRLARRCLFVFTAHSSSRYPQAI